MVSLSLKQGVSLFLKRRVWLFLKWSKSELVSKNLMRLMVWFASLFHKTLAALGLSSLSSWLTNQSLSLTAAASKSSPATSWLASIGSYGQPEWPHYQTYFIPELRPIQKSSYLNQTVVSLSLNKGFLYS